MVQENFLKIDGHKIRYLDSGNSKNNLVLIHGLGASAERWLSVIPHFSKDFRVIVPDLIGKVCAHTIFPDFHILIFLIYFGWAP